MIIEYIIETSFKIETPFENGKVDIISNPYKAENIQS